MTPAIQSEIPRQSRSFPADPTIILWKRKEKKEEKERKKEKEALSYNSTKGADKSGKTRRRRRRRRRRIKETEKEQKEQLFPTFLLSISPIEILKNNGEQTTTTTTTTAAAATTITASKFWFPIYPFFSMHFKFSKIGVQLWRHQVHPSLSPPSLVSIFLLGPTSPYISSRGSSLSCSPFYWVSFGGNRSCSWGSGWGVLCFVFPSSSSMETLG